MRGRSRSIADGMKARLASARTRVCAGGSDKSIICQSSFRRGSSWPCPLAVNWSRMTACSSAVHVARVADAARALAAQRLMLQEDVEQAIREAEAANVLVAGVAVPGPAARACRR